MRSSCFRILVALLIATGGRCATSQEAIDLPVKPVNPSREDCEHLFQAYSALKRSTYEQETSCMTARPTIATTKGCSGVATLSAWPQCQPLALQMCRLDAVQASEYQACLADVPPGQIKSIGDQELASDLRESNSLIEKGQASLDFMSDPVAFLQDTLNPVNPLSEALFNGPDKGMNTDLGDEVYRFALDYARLGLRSTQNPLLRAFQQAWLNQVGRALKGVLDQADEVGRQMAAIEVDKSSGSITTSRARPTSLLRDPDCSVFDNEDASRALMEQDHERWLSLYQTCAPKN